MKCPVCKTECWDYLICLECGFDNISPTFISKEEGDFWIENVVLPWRSRYWSMLEDYEFVGTTIIKYNGCEEKIVIPYGIEIIGEEAFKNNKLIKEVFFPETVKYIEYSAFWNAEALVSAAFSEGLESIGAYAFEYCDLRSVCIPSTCTEIDIGAFCGCYNLKTIFLSNGIKEVGEEAFRHCDEVEMIIIPESLQEIGPGAFSFGKTNVAVSIHPRNNFFEVVGKCIVNDEGCIVAGTLSNGIPENDAVNSIGNAAYTCGVAKDGVLLIPPNIQTIENYAFEFCDISYVYIPKTVKNIERAAFLGIKNCRFFCESKDSPKGWTEAVAGASNSFLSLGCRWKMESGKPEIVLIDKSKYSATLISYEYDDENDQIEMWIRCKNKTSKTVRFVINSMKIDDDLCTCTHWGNIEADSEVRCKFIYEDTEFKTAFISDAEKITLDMCIQNDEQYVLAKGNSVSLPGFYIPDENEENDSLPF